MNDNMKIYDAVRTAPPTALRQITAGRLKGKSDINPMWRIKALTEQFGPCGIGWKYTIEKLWTEQGAGGEIAAFALINVYIKQGEKWSEPIPGIGGNSFVTKETKGMYTNDECYKMALTDAISVACKSLGFAADVYWQSDCTKYDQNNRTQEETVSEESLNAFYALGKRKGYDQNRIAEWAKQNMGNFPEKLTQKQLDPLINAMKKWPDYDPKNTQC